MAYKQCNERGEPVALYVTRYELDELRRFSMPGTFDAAAMRFHGLPIRLLPEDPPPPPPRPTKWYGRVWRRLSVLLSKRDDWRVGDAGEDND